MIRIITAFLLYIMVHSAQTQSLADKWIYKGEVLNEPGYDLWGSSPIQDEDGRTHLFTARWKSDGVFSVDWRYKSEIAHYIADHPEGPFTFVEVVLSPEKDGKGWRAAGYHNPNIRKIGDKYALVFIANDGSTKHGPNQRIGMITADNLNGPWTHIPNENTPILSPPDNETGWCFNSGCGVNNPSLLQHPKGHFLLYFKSMTGPRTVGKVKMGVAVSDKLEGPYVIKNEPITNNNVTIEDGYAFLWQSRIYLLTTDNHGILEEGGGLLWSSEDGLKFDSIPESGFHNFSKFYLKDSIPEQANLRYGSLKRVKFERPQMLINEFGIPEYLYCPSGTALDGSDGTNSYILKYKSDIKKE